LDEGGVSEFDAVAFDQRFEEWLELFEGFSFLVHEIIKYLFWLRAAIKDLFSGLE
jgi:hypothetical protein